MFFWLLFLWYGGYKYIDGYFYLTGRVDNVINVARHRLSTAKMEEIVAAQQVLLNVR